MFFKALSTAFILQYCKYNQSKELTFKWYFLNQIDKKRPPGKFIKLAWFVREIIKSYPTPYPPSVNWDYNVSGLWICEIFTDVEFLSKYAVLCTTRKLPQEGSKASHITLSRPNHIFFHFLVWATSKFKPLLLMFICRTLFTRQTHFKNNQICFGKYNTLFLPQSSIIFKNMSFCKKILEGLGFLDSSEKNVARTRYFCDWPSSLYLACLAHISCVRDA